MFYSYCTGDPNYVLQIKLQNGYIAAETGWKWMSYQEVTDNLATVKALTATWGMYSLSDGMI